MSSVLIGLLANLRPLRVGDFIFNFMLTINHNKETTNPTPANHQGIPEESTLSFALGKERSGFSAREITRIVEDVYSRYADQFNIHQVSFLSFLLDLSVPAKETTIPDDFFSVLPESIKNPVTIYEGRERDYFTLSLLPLQGATLENNVWGRYYKSISHCKLYTMIVAPPASGKGVMNDAKHLFSAIEKQRRDMYKTFTMPVLKKRQPKED